MRKKLPIGIEAMRFPFLMESEQLSDDEKAMYRALVEVKNGLFTMPDAALMTSLQTLMFLLSKHYGRKVILLIDEYDVPLDKAFQAGYYEVRELFVYQIREWFRDVSGKDAPKLGAFCEAFPAGDAEGIEKQFNDYLWNAISIRDTFVPKEQKENFYHGVLLGLLQYKENWLVHSNVEFGEGYSDILVEVPESRTGVVIEMKYAEGDRLDLACAEALKQIERKKYASRLEEDGMQTILKYGIACFRKHCKVTLEPRS